MIFFLFYYNHGDGSITHNIYVSWAVNKSLIQADFYLNLGWKDFVIFLYNHSTSIQWNQQDYGLFKLNTLMHYWLKWFNSIIKLLVPFVFLSWKLISNWFESILIKKIYNEIEISRFLRVCSNYREPLWKW